jgi:cytochrome P450
LTWTLLLLAQHPQVAHDLLDEIKGVIQDRPPTAVELDRMPLLTSVIEESMRILPPVPSNMRMALEPAQLGEYELEPGDRVICSHYVTHHLPELYPEPERFRPERWQRRPGPFEYIPFSAGPRFCLGYNFAMTVLKVAVVMLLQRYRVSLIDRSRIDRVVRVTLRPRRGLPLVLSRADGLFQAVSLRGNINQMVRFEG